MTHTLGKTPWVDAALREHLDRIAEKVDASLLPQRVSTAKKFTAVEYGCGHYGCVMPTADAAVVIKLTSDETEAQFVSTALSFGSWPEGIVRYLGIYRLPNVQRRKRNVYVLWREAAFDVGWPTRPIDHMLRHEAQNLVSYLRKFQGFAAEVRKRIVQSGNPQKLLAETKRLEDWAFRNVDLGTVEGHQHRLQQRGAHAVAWSLRACEIVAELMENTDGIYLIGQALDFYLAHGLLLADVHVGNVGRVARTDFQRAPTVITDPGHVVAVDPGIVVPQVPLLYGSAAQ